MKCQKVGEDRTQNRKESCCGRSFASDRISAKTAWPRARHRSRQFRGPAERARLLPDRQIPASRHISRSDSRLQEIANSSRLSVKRASFKRSSRPRGSKWLVLPTAEPKPERGALSR